MLPQRLIPMLRWESVRNIMSTKQRMAISLLRDKDEVIHLLTIAKAEVRQKQIYDILSIKPGPIGKFKMIILEKSAYMVFKISSINCGPR